MSEIPKTGFASQKPQVSRILEEDEDCESTATGTTVIARFTSIERTLDLYDPNQSLQSCPQHELSEAEEEVQEKSSLPQVQEHMETIRSKNYSLDQGTFYSPKRLSKRKQRYAPVLSQVSERIRDLQSKQSQFCPQHELPPEDEEEYFSFDKMLRDEPYPSWVATIQRDEDPEPVGLTMSHSLPPLRSPTEQDVTLESISERASSSQVQESMETTLSKSHSLADETSSPRRLSKRRRRSSYVSGSVLSSPVDTGLGDLDAKSALFLARHLKPAALQKPQLHTADQSKKQQFSGNISEALRENAMLMEELKRDAKSIGIKKGNEPCPCDVMRHPRGWSIERIQNIHDYSFLLNCQDLEFNKDIMIATNIAEDIVVYDVPMDSNNMIKKKAEQVLRFVDVEIGFGDQTCRNLYHYVQPSHRKVLLVISNQRVVGILVAEGITSAHRLLRETSSYMVLEDQPVPVRIGINRLWVHISLRRKHLATILCRLVGKCFYEEESLNDEDYAFNNVSDAMVMFAKIYLKTLRPPLYYKY